MSGDKDERIPTSDLADKIIEEAFLGTGLCLSEKTRPRIKKCVMQKLKDLARKNKSKKDPTNMIDAAAAEGWDGSRSKYWFWPADAKFLLEEMEGYVEKKKKSWHEEAVKDKRNNSEVASAWRAEIERDREREALEEESPRLGELDLGEALEVLSRDTDDIVNKWLIARTEMRQRSAKAEGAEDPEADGDGDARVRGLSPDELFNIWLRGTFRNTSLFKDGDGSVAPDMSSIDGRPLWELDSRQLHDLLVDFAIEGVKKYFSDRGRVRGEEEGKIDSEQLEREALQIKVSAIYDALFKPLETANLRKDLELESELIWLIRDEASLNEKKLDDEERLRNINAIARMSAELDDVRARLSKPSTYCKPLDISSGLRKEIIGEACDAACDAAGDEARKVASQEFNKLVRQYARQPKRNSSDQLITSTQSGRPSQGSPRST